MEEFKMRALRHKCEPSCCRDHPTTSKRRRTVRAGRVRASDFCSCRVKLAAPTLR